MVLLISERYCDPVLLEIYQKAVYKRIKKFIDVFLIYGLHMHQLDVETAPLQEEVYILPPAGVEIPNGLAIHDASYITAYM